MGRALLFGLLLVTRLAAQDLPPEVLAMSRASRSVGETVSALSNCVCLESVARASVDKKGKVTQLERDALQIEVTTIGDREWFSWPGSADTFVRDPAALVGFGMMNTGQLTSNLKTVFLGGFAKRSFHTAGAFQGRQGFEFDYSIPSALTHYRLNTAKGSVLAGMQGSFWIDQRGGELLGLATEATEIPADFDVRSVRTEVAYAPMYLDEKRVVIPQTAITRVAHTDGSASINRVEFSHCRPYSTTSSISFEEPSAIPSAPSTPTARGEPSPLPAGLSLPMRLEAPITERTLAGQRIAMIMEADARSRGALLVAKGAKVQGRVRRIEATKCPEQCLLVAIELLSVSAADGNDRPVYASLQQVRPEPKVVLDIAGVRSVSSDMPFGMRRVETMGEVIRIPKIPGVGGFFVRNGVVTPPDLLMTWDTESARK